MMLDAQKWTPATHLAYEMQLQLAMVSPMHPVYLGNSGSVGWNCLPRQSKILMQFPAISNDASGDFEADHELVDSPDPWLKRAASNKRRRLAVKPLNALIDSGNVAEQIDEEMQSVRSSITETERCEGCVASFVNCTHCGVEPLSFLICRETERLLIEHANEHRRRICLLWETQQMTREHVAVTAASAAATTSMTSKLVAAMRTNVQLTPVLVQ